MNCRVFRSTPGLYPLDFRGTTPPHLGDTKNADIVKWTLRPKLSPIENPGATLVILQTRRVKSLSCCVQTLHSF